MIRTNSTFSRILAILAIVTISLSVLVCAYVSFNTTNMADMQTTDMGGHFDHAYSLTRAVVPAVGLALISFAIIFFIGFVPSLALSVPQFLYARIETSQVIRTRRNRYLFNPRSPPIA